MATNPTGRPSTADNAHGPVGRALVALLDALDQDLIVGPPSEILLAQLALAVSAVFAFLGYIAYRYLLLTAPHPESTTPRPVTPERTFEGGPTPTAEIGTPLISATGRRRRTTSVGSDTSATSPVQQLIQQFGGNAGLPASPKGARAVPGPVPRGTLVSPRAPPPVTPAAVTPPAVDTSSGSGDLSGGDDRGAAAAARLPVPAGALEERDAPGATLDPHWGMGRGSDEVLTADVPDGMNHVDWPDGSEYLGEWVGGHPHGRGTYVWPSGIRYDGEWADGREEGVGTLAAPDGAAYYGFWSKGLMQGQGVYRPATAGNKRAEVIFLRRYEGGLLRKETVLRVADYDMYQANIVKTAKAAALEQSSASGDVQQKKQGELVVASHHYYQLVQHLQLGIMFSIAQASTANLAPAKELMPSDYRIRVKQTFPRLAGAEGNFKWKDYCPVVFERLRCIFHIDSTDYLLSLTGTSSLRELASPGKSGSVFFLSEDDRFLVKTVSKSEARLLLELLPAYYQHCAANPNTLLTPFYGVHRISSSKGQRVRVVIMGNVFPTETRLHRKYDLKGSTYGRTVGPAALSDPNAVLKDLDLDVQVEVGAAQRAALLEQVARDTQLLEKLRIMDYSLLLGLHFPAWGASTWLPPSSHLKGENGHLKLDRLAAALSGRHGHTATREVYSSICVRSSDASSVRSSTSATRMAQPFSVSKAPEERPGASGRVRPEWDPSMDSLIQLAVDQPGPRGPRGARTQWAPPEPLGGSNAGPRSPFFQHAELLAEEGGGASQLPNGRDSLPNGPLSGNPRDSQGSGLRSLRRLRMPEPVRRLGDGMPGRVLPLHDSLGKTSEPAVMYFGIIDFLQEYNLRKRTEHLLKSVVIKSSKVSVTDPAAYARRFRQFVSDLFISRYNGSSA